jgi:hypothetical protein
VESNSLGYQLLAGPSGASVDPGSGTLTWRPTIAQAGQSYTVVTAATDNGTNALSTTNTNLISVNAVQVPKVALWWSNSEAGSGSVPQVNLAVVEGQAGPDYILQASTDLQQWSTILTNAPASFPWLWTDTNSYLFEHRFYRIRLGP